MNIEDLPISSSFEEFYHGNRFHLTVGLHNHFGLFLNQLKLNAIFTISKNMYAIY